MSIHCRLSVLMGEKRYRIQDVHEKTGLARTTISNLYHDKMERVGDLAPYLEALKIDLFLTANPYDAQATINRKVPAATLLTNNIPDYNIGNSIREIRIAFDGDAVLFFEESEAIYKQKGLETFVVNEELNAKSPMNEGPFAEFLKTIS